MKQIALGCLGWKPDDFDKYEARHLIMAINGYDHDQKQRWERVRVQCAYMIMPYHDTKKHGPLKFIDITLPIDADEPKAVVNKKKNEKGGRMSREELKAYYIKNGLQISESRLDQIYKSK